MEMGELIWLTGPSRLHRNSPQGLNISSIRVFDQIRDPKTQSAFAPTSMKRKMILNFKLHMKTTQNVLHLGTGYINLKVSRRKQVLFGLRKVEKLTRNE